MDGVELLERLLEHDAAVAVVTRAAVQPQEPHRHASCSSPAPGRLAGGGRTRLAATCGRDCNATRRGAPVTRAGEGPTRRLVPEVGFEPTRPFGAPDFESSASTSSATPARCAGAYSDASGRACASSRRRAPASAPWHSRESHGTLETAREGSAGIRAAVRASREEGLQLAIQAIAKDPKDVKTALATKKSANEIRRFYEIEPGRLFRGEPTMEVVKSRALLRRLDVVGLRLNEAADRLSDAAIKRWA